MVTIQSEGSDNQCLQLLIVFRKREPAGILGDVADIIGEDGLSLAKLAGTGLLAGFTGATGSKAATAVFNHTR